ncbi:DUF1003 domain-containing protein [Pontibacter sp. 172403-2]|uniref:DUF1003 domain-containing protein n=1 Tax=Pontibacter rufus TaxID=2791028 RepID=UPI0018AFF75E|nr:DUF1003 domain-containing protein [Pontibacter sp. 172403-2]MBF9254702.1 DUF1003 domain-containing protein [Pontibacter sp. 172403-2]
MRNKQQNGMAPDERGRMTHVVERNIEALLERKKQEDKARKTQDKVADSITRFAGSMAYVYIHLVLYSVWVIWNLGWLGLKPFDESFVVLGMIASVEAIFLSTFVLISQNRMSAQADKRAELDLQVSLLSEHEITQLIKLVRAIAAKMDIAESHNPEIDELAKNVAPEKVLDKVEEKQEEMEKS